MKTKLIVIVMMGLLGFAAALHAEPLAIGKGDDIRSVLATYKGKRVTVNLASGEEMTGFVREANGKLLHLGELSGKEFYDAAIALDEVIAISVRVRDK